MQVAKQVVVQLMTELGFKGAETLSSKRLLDKLRITLPKIDEETVEEIDDEDASALVAKLVKTPALVDKLEIEEEEEEEKPAKKAGKKPAKKAKAEADDDGDDDDTDDDADDDADTNDDDADAEADDDSDADADEDEKPAKKPAKKKPAKKAGRPAKAKDEDDEEKPAKKKPAKAARKPATARKVGVVATIIAELEKASKKAPVTREHILKTLAKKFPDREPSGMKVTVYAHLSHHLKARRNLDVRRNEEGGFWLA